MNLYVPGICWFFGIVFLVLSHSSRIIMKTNHIRKGWRKYQTGYFIREIRDVIELVDSIEVKKALQKKILYREISILLFVLSVATLIIQSF